MSMNIMTHELNKVGVSELQSAVTRFKELQAYFKNHGKLPSGKDDPKLSIWFKICKRKFKLQKLNPSLCAMFNQASIDLNCTITRGDWNGMLSELSNFVKQMKLLTISTNKKENSLIELFTEGCI